MELKYICAGKDANSGYRSNCTFMELKLAFSNLRVVGLLF